MLCQDCSLLIPAVKGYLRLTVLYQFVSWIRCKRAFDRWIFWDSEGCVVAQGFQVLEKDYLNLLFHNYEFLWKIMDYDNGWFILIQFVNNFTLNDILPARMKCLESFESRYSCFPLNEKFVQLR